MFLGVKSGAILTVFAASPHSNFGVTRGLTNAKRSCIYDLVGICPRRSFCPLGRGSSCELLLSFSSCCSVRVRKEPTAARPTAGWPRGSRGRTRRAVPAWTQARNRVACNLGRLVALIAAALVSVTQGRMFMLRSVLAAASAATLLVGVATSAYSQSGANVGSLTCNVAGGIGFVFGSSKDLSCLFTPSHPTPDKYTGSIKQD